MKRRAPSCLGYIGDEILHSYIWGITINPCKDPYLKTSIMERKKVVFVAQMLERTPLKALKYA